jgi:hypothetical protein
MPTIKSIQQQIKVLVDELETQEMKKAVKTRMLKKVAFLRACIKYIETNPTTEFIKQEQTRIEKFITAKAEEFDRNVNPEATKKIVTKERKDFEKMYEIPKKRIQLRTLRFLLT